jgi:hypothetical protein
MFRTLVVRQTIQASADLFQLAGSGHARQYNAGNINLIQVTWAQQSLLMRQNKNALTMTVSLFHEWIMFLFFVEIK